MSISPSFVYVVDDDAPVRRALELFFRVSGLQSQGFSGGKAFLAAYPKLRPGCIFSDLRMPGMSGLEMLRRLRAAGCRWPVVIVTCDGSTANAQKAVRAGALAFLQKPLRENELLAAVKGAQAYLGSEPQPLYAREMADRIQSLSQRQRSVFDGIVQGLLNKQIAARLEISESCVKSARRRILRRMQAETTLELIAMALRGGVKITAPS